MHEFDDTHLPIVIHPTAPVPAHWAPFPNKTKIVANFMNPLALGIEIIYYMGDAIPFNHYEYGRISVNIKFFD